TFQLHDDATAMGSRKLFSAILMGAAISAMHYTGMAAATFAPAALTESVAHAVGISSLGTLVISSFTAIVLGLTILTSVVDRRFSVQALNLANTEERLG